MDAPPAALPGIFVAFFGMMLAMGLEVRLSDFTRIASHPRAASAGLAGQLVGLPLAAILVGIALQVPPEVGAGMAIIAACPGGALSNAIAYLAGGNVALSISLTCASTAAGILTVPFVANLGFRAFGLDPAEVYLPILPTVGQLVVLVICPVAIGMIIAAKRPDWAARARVPMRRLASVLFAVLIAIMLIGDPEPLIAAAPAALLPAVALSLTVVILGYGAARAVRSSQQDSLTISVEIVVQNVPLATLIVFNILERGEFIGFILVYALVLLPVSLGWAFGFRALKGLAKPEHP